MVRDVHELRKGRKGRYKQMGYYLNSTQMLSLYEGEVKSPYFVDKSMLLAELIPLVKSGNKHICITRPRRFGKSVMAAMVGAFFAKVLTAVRFFGP